jgi:lauroyl/myristoyl acyltransferase
VTANQACVLGLDASDERVRSRRVRRSTSTRATGLDTFRLRDVEEEVTARTELRGRERLDRALERGSGCICVLPHMGN